LFYQYDGGQSQGIPNSAWIAPPNQLWQFVPSENGTSGQWSQLPIQTSSFAPLSRVDGATFGSGDGQGYALGGFEDVSTDEDFAQDEAVFSPPGMVIFDTKSKQWTNSSLSAVSPLGTAQAGATQYVPSYGPEGLLLMIGGLYTTTFSGTAQDYPSQQFFSLNNISIYDPSEQQWHWQTADGEVPGPVRSHCLVGVEGDDDTFEVSRLICHPPRFEYL
jgi:hypothetical protein